MSTPNGQQEEIDINLEDPQVKEAAKKIQSVFRVKRVADNKKAAAAAAAAAAENTAPQAGEAK